MRTSLEARQCPACGRTFAPRAWAVRCLRYCQKRLARRKTAGLWSQRGGELTFVPRVSGYKANGATVSHRAAYRGYFAARWRSAG